MNDNQDKSMQAFEEWFDEMPEPAIKVVKQIARLAWQARGEYDLRCRVTMPDGLSLNDIAKLLQLLALGKGLYVADKETYLEEINQVLKECLKLEEVPQEKREPDIVWEGEPIFNDGSSIEAYEMVSDLIKSELKLHQRYRVEFFEITEKPESGI